MSSSGTWTSAGPEAAGERPAEAEPVGRPWRQRFQVFGEPPPPRKPTQDKGEEAVSAGPGPNEAQGDGAESSGASADTTPSATDKAVQESQIDRERLESAFTWTAGGFTALISVLTFFGIKEGTLDQALRVYAPATLCVFIFLGIGVVSALFARAIDFDSRLRLWALVALLLVMLVAASVFFPNLDEMQARELERSGLTPGQSRWDVARPWLAALVVLVVLVVGVWLLARTAPADGLPLRQLSTVAVLGLVVAVWLLLPRSVDPGTGESSGLDEQRLVTTLLAVSLLLGAVWLLGWSLVNMTTLPTMAGLVVVAVTATSLGLYGATKLAVQSKSLSVLPQVVAKMQNAEGATSVELSVTVGRFRGRNLVVELVGIPRGQAPRTLDATSPDRATAPVTIWGALLRPDALDEINQTIDVPVSPTRWEELSVRYCSLADQDAMAPLCEVEGTRASVVKVRNRGPEQGLEQVTAKIAPAESGTLRAIFTATDVTPGVLTRVELCRTRAGNHTTHVVDVTLGPDSDGNLAWEAVVPAGKGGDTLVLRHASCPPGSPCSPSQWSTLATYVTE